MRTTAGICFGLFTAFLPLAAESQDIVPFGGVYLGLSEVDVQPSEQWDDPRGMDLGVLGGVRLTLDQMILGAEFSVGNSLGANDDFDLIGTGDLDIGVSSSVSLMVGALSNENIILYGRGGYQWTKIEDEDAPSNPDDTFGGPQLALGLEWAQNFGARTRFEVIRTYYRAETLTGVETDLDQTALRVSYLLSF